MPRAFDTFWQSCEKRLNKYEGTRVMVNLLPLGREQGGPKGFKALHQAVESALVM